ncbi:MAG: hypothetical protein WAM05_05545 [Candidatus Binataceae bacterium]
MSANGSSASCHEYEFPTWKSARRRPARTDCRCGYLQLSDGYGAFASEAEKAGWVTLRASADHLAVLTRPEVVCNALFNLIEALGI